MQDSLISAYNLVPLCHFVNTLKPRLKTIMVIRLRPDFRLFTEILQACGILVHFAYDRPCTGYLKNKFSKLILNILRMVQYNNAIF